MIYTITTNPSLDYYLGLKELSVGKLNRSLNEEYDAAGKGVNVSKFLSNLGLTSTALGFLGGFTRNYYLELLSKFPNIQPQFTTVKEATRINIKIHCGEETSLNAKGPYISLEEFEKFTKKFNNMYNDDFAVLSGNIQEEMVQGIIDSVGQLSKDGTKIVLDTDDVVVDGLLPYNPYLVSISKHIDDRETLLKIAKDYLNRGANLVLYCRDEKLTYLFEKDGYYTCDLNGLKFKSLTGSADCMLAGFLWARVKGASSNEAFLYGNGITTCLDILETKEVKIDEIEDNCKKVIVERCEY